MLQHHAINTAGNAQLAILDLSTVPPTRHVVDYANGAERFERDPARWRPEAMGDAEHAAAVEGFRARQAATAATEE
jgi:hypothetical protein